MEKDEFNLEGWKLFEE